VPLRKIKNTVDALHLVIGEYDGELRDSVSGFAQSDWNSCISRKLFLTRDYLSVCEKIIARLSNRFYCCERMALHVQLPIFNSLTPCRTVGSSISIVWRIGRTVSEKLINCCFIRFR
jgi:hypothetical protein